MGLDSDQVTYERRGAAAVVTIDRQERRNAVDGPTAALLTDAYERFVADDDARVLVLTGAGDVSFCAGADLKAIETFVPRLALDDGPLGFTRLIPPKPTIAAIGGWCLAGGLELALWCDLRVAAEGSQLGFTERRFGVPLVDGGTQRLPRIVGPRPRARHDPDGPDRCRPTRRWRWACSPRSCPPGRHLERALEIAEALARFPQETMLADRRRSDRRDRHAVLGRHDAGGRERPAHVRQWRPRAPRASPAARGAAAPGAGA